MPDRESVEVHITEANHTSDLWDISAREETYDMLSRSDLPEESQVDVLRDAVRILSQCVPPGDGVDRRAGLVIGNVQSGKTASFITVTALAHDNNIGIVILLLGTTTNLVNQGRRRLGDTLHLSGPGRYRVWRHFQSPSTSEDARGIEEALRPRLSPAAVGSKPTVIITLMKHHQHLADAAEVLQRCDADLEKVTALVIDDEADQASPDTSRAGEAPSTTYRTIRQLTLMFRADVEVGLSAA